MELPLHEAPRKGEGGRERRAEGREVCYPVLGKGQRETERAGRKRKKEDKEIANRAHTHKHGSV